MPRENVSAKIESMIPHLFLEIIEKKMNTAKEIMPSKIAKYKSTKIRDRKSTPKTKPKQTA
jgi:hypothetical protein